ncbi:hypothetical protein [Micromonospora sp. NPDC051006]|uniref:hypothetical protein n=1 Tax=Micromonospora sp. NPDC051006 TaxID=3364283 RepID=UPI00378D4AD0
MHGVSGASAEEILDHPVVVRVAGDHHAGFYRVRPGMGTGGGTTEGIPVEAYRWGALTAGAAVRTASRLLLLPFMLVNVAVWMRPTAADRFGLLTVLCRLLAGTLTAAFVLSIIGVTLDLVGWQCVPYDECRDGRPYLAWLRGLPVGPRLVVLSIVPLVALWVIWSIGARSAQALEGFGLPRQLNTAIDEGLDEPGFWDDERSPAWLRQVHAGIGIGTLDASLLGGLSNSESDAGLWLLIAPLGLLMFCAVLLCLPVPTSPERVRSLLRPLWAATAAITILSLTYAALTRPAQLPVGQLPGYEGSVATLIAAQGCLLALLAAVTNARLRHVTHDVRPLLRSFGAPVVAAASVIVGQAFAATLVYRVADLLDRGSVPGPVRPSPSGVAPLDPPVGYWWAALAALAALIVVGASGSTALLLSRRRRRSLAEQVVRQDYPVTPPGAAHRLAAVREAIARSHLTEELGPMLIAFFLVSSLGLATIALDLLGIGPTQLATRLGTTHQGNALLAAYVTDGGIWIISLLVIGLLILGFRSYRSPDTRRLVAVLWDLGNFWPRTVHPFAPPCYSARAVPELARRVSALTGEGTVVVISGHSHGSILAAAAILQLPAPVRRRVGLLTPGSPLARLYARLYPAYFGGQTLCELGGRLDWRWRNLWRDTDPIAGPIFHRRGDDSSRCGDRRAYAVDVRLRDPRGLTIDPTDTVPPPIERHWPYHTQPQYWAAVRELADQTGQHGDRGQPNFHS